MSDNTRKTSETAQQVKHEAGQRKEQVVDTAKQQAAHAMERAENTSAEAREKYINPARDFMSDRLQQRPIVTTFLTLFLALSAVPVLTFTVFAISSCLVVGGTALVSSLAILGFLVGSAALLLGGTLFLTGTGALIGTLMLGSTYSAYRLAMCLTHAPSLAEGLRSFQLEMRSMLVGPEGGVHVDTEGDTKSLAFKVQTK